MIPDLRAKYNAEFSQSAYNNFLADLNSTVRYPADFRVSETPIFISEELKNELIRAGDQIISQLSTEEFRKHSLNAIPSELNVPGENSHPLFLQIDFAICKNDFGNYVPMLIELQGFPSLYGYQFLLNQKFRKHFSIPDNFSAFFNNLDFDSYQILLKNTLIGNHDPENVILMEISPDEQKTRIDFAVTEKLTGIKTVDIQEIFQKDKKLFYEKERKRIRIERIYNRVIFDELQRKNLEIKFPIFDELKVEWAGHPNWFFRISKHSLPFLKNVYNPNCFFLNDLKSYPEDLQNYVLKPLYSFAGHGVEVELTKEFLDSVKDRNNYILQQKIKYAPLIKTLDVNSKVEIRMMYLWDKKPLLVNNLVRMSKGKMMGVDHNKNRTWVGSSIAYYKK
ncbi:MAG TPA: hypothetical protein VKA26_14820 [Ignavibacteriaceae bacterium]|nr:hypothetical protein [Ignavibacteriaceae bacterium]